MQEQVDHSLHPNDSHCYFKRADICWRVERGSFQRNDESPVLDCSERGPLEWIKMWHKGWKRRKKALSNKSHLFFKLYIFSLCSFLLCLLCQQFWFQCAFPPKQFWECSQREKYCISIWLLLLLLLLGLLQWLLIIRLCLELRWFLCSMRLCAPAKVSWLLHAPLKMIKYNSITF